MVKNHANEQLRVIKIPDLGISPLCPISALKKLLALQIPDLGKHFPQFSTSFTLVNPTSTFTHFDVQVPPWPLIPVFLFKTFRVMAPGRRSASGLTSLKTTKLLTKWP